MAEAANLSVSITGDASGLISALSGAEAAIGQVSGAAGKLMSDFDGKEAKMKLTAVDNTAAGVASAKAGINSLTDKTVTISVRYNMIGMPKLAGGTKNALGGLSVVNDERGKSDPRELIEHNGSLLMFNGRDVIVPLSRGDKVYTADETKRIMSGLGLPHYASGKNNEAFQLAKSDYTHYKKTHNMTPYEELEAWNKMLEDFSYDSEVMREIQEEIFSAQQKVWKIESEKNYAVYKKWQSDAKNWKTIRDTYGDWEESGDSKVKFYERSIQRIGEMYRGGYVGWQEYRDDTMGAILNLHKAKMEEVDTLLASQKKYISDTKQRFSNEEKALSDSWAVEDRKTYKAEISRQLDIFEGAVTQRGMDKYKSLQDEMKKIRREEEMYALQKTHTEIITRLEDSYAKVEENKKYLLGVIERSGLNLEGIVNGARYDIEGMQSTITALFMQTISAIKGIRVSSNSYSDNRKINISGGSSAALDALQNRIAGSIAHGNFY